MKKKIVVLSFLALMFLFATESKAWPLPQKYMGFIFETPTSGWLLCSGEGTCAEVIGNLVYFGIYVGNWHDEAQP